MTEPTTIVSDNARPVWLTREQVDLLIDVSAGANTAMLYPLIVAWDAAPADAEEAVERALRCHDVEDAVDIAAQAVLRALGKPDAARR